MRWYEQCGGGPSGESNFSEEESDYVQNNNIVPNLSEHSEYSGESSGDSDDDHAVSTACTATSIYPATGGLVLSKVPSGKNKIEPHNIIRRTPGLPGKHMATAA